MPQQVHREVSLHLAPCATAGAWRIKTQSSLLTARADCRTLPDHAFRRRERGVIGSFEVRKSRLMFGRLASQLDMRSWRPFSQLILTEVLSWERFTWFTRKWSQEYDREVIIRRSARNRREGGEGVVWWLKYDVTSLLHHQFLWMRSQSCLALFMSFD